VLCVELYVINRPLKLQVKRRKEVEKCWSPFKREQELRKSWWKLTGYYGSKLSSNFELDASQSSWIYRYMSIKKCPSRKISPPPRPPCPLVFPTSLITYVWILLKLHCKFGVNIYRPEMNTFCDWVRLISLRDKFFRKFVLYNFIVFHCYDQPIIALTYLQQEIRSF
jgi:hypothetical protein